MKKIVEIIRPGDVFNIYWTLTDFCNFKCNYCLPSLHSGDYYHGRKPGYPTDSQISTFIDNLINQHLQGRRLHLAIGGGEPTLHPMFEEIIKRLSPYGEISVTTNGSRSFEWWKNLPALPDAVFISLHPEFTKIDKINENAKYLVDAGVNVRFNLSCDPAHWSGTVAMYDNLLPELKRFVLPKVLNHLESDRSNYDYSPEQSQWMRQRQTEYNIAVKTKLVKETIAFKMQVINEDRTISPMPRLADITINKQHGFRGWQCEAGVATLNVHFDGRVWGSICKSKILGPIDSFELATEPLICGVDWCTCPGDLIIPKRMIKIETA